MCIVKAILLWLRGVVSNRAELAAENLALRQQLSVLQRGGKRANVTQRDRIFWVWLSRLWGNWRSVLLIVQPSTVVKWHRQGFKLYWRWRSEQGKVGRPKTDVEIRQLIRQMCRENPTWGAPRIHGEIQKLGLEVSERTVSRTMPRRPANPDERQRWRTFLASHREVIAAIDFFTDPTVTFRVLYVFFVAHHARRELTRTRRLLTPAPTGPRFRRSVPYRDPHARQVERDHQADLPALDLQADAARVL